METALVKPEELDEITGLLKLSMPLDNITASLVKENVFDDVDYDPPLALAAREGDEITGFIMGVIRKREDDYVGYIKLLAVRPDKRRQGTASSLYDAIEAVFRERHIKKVRLFECYPNYFMPGVDPFYTEAVCFFERKGFKKFGDTSNLEADLENQEFDTESEEEKLKDKGIEVRRAKQDDYGEVMEWTKKNFSAWETEVKNTFENDPVTLHLAFKNGRVEAFSAHEGNNRGLGWFGPMGTTQNLRGLGMGGILYKRCLKDMQEMGYKKAIIPWVGPIPFYMHYSGARVKRVFWRYEKILE